MPAAARRPSLTPATSTEEFRAWYWLKEELVAFCRAHDLSSAGLKREIEARICAYLSGNEDRRPRVQPRRDGVMPQEFTPQTVIGKGWRCSPALGAFFRSVVGRSFRFNGPMRAFIHAAEGSTLADAAIVYQNSVRPGAPKRPIAEQLEYNRHFREFFRDHPGASRDAAIAAWWIKRSSRRQDNSGDERPRK